MSTSKAGDKPSALCSESYNGTLSKHHGWMVRKTIGVAFMTLPNRQPLLKVWLGPDEDTWSLDPLVYVTPTAPLRAGQQSCAHPNAPRSQILRPLPWMYLCTLTPQLQFALRKHAKGVRQLSRATYQTRAAEHPVETPVPMAPRCQSCAKPTAWVYVRFLPGVVPVASVVFT